MIITATREQCNMVNLTDISIQASILTRDPNFNYVNWCVDQQIYFQSSVNQVMLLFIGLAWLFLIVASLTFKFEKYRKYHESVLHMVRLSLVLTVAAWFLFVYLGIVWFE